MISQLPAPVVASADGLAIFVRLTKALWSRLNSRRLCGPVQWRHRFSPMAKSGRQLANVLPAEALLPAAYGSKAPAPPYCEYPG